MDNRALAYLRVSTEEQSNNGLSLPAQESAIRGYAQLRGLDLIETITDAGISGARPLATRPGGKRLLQLLSEGVATNVLVYKLDRAFRSAADCLATLEAWRRKGIRLHVVDLGGATLDSETASGKFFLTILAAVSEMEKNLISERTRSILQWKKSNGQIYGPEPFGYRREGDRLVPVSQELEALTLIRQLRAEGYSLRAIARELEKNGIPTKRGGVRWSPEAIRKILTRP